MNRAESKYFVTAGKMDEAFIELLGKKDFEYITVKEICEKAGVNRSTFYLHYETIADLLGESMEYIDRQFFSYFAENSRDLVAKIPDMKPEELNFVNAHFLIPYLNYVKDNRKVFQATINHPEALNAGERYTNLYKYVIDPVMDKYGVPRDKRVYYNTFFLNGMLAVIKEWVRQDCKDSPEEVSDIIESLVIR